MSSNKPLLYSFVILFSVTGGGCGCNQWAADTAESHGSERLTPITEAFDASEEVVEVLSKNKVPKVFQNADRIVIVRPYTDLETVNFHGVDGVQSIESAISQSDGINLLVFVDSDTNRILGWADVSRRVIDFRVDQPSVTVDIMTPHRRWDKSLRATSGHEPVEK